MKTRILSLLLVLVMAVGMLASCSGGTTCTAHTDANGDLKCDTCGADVECTNHVTVFLHLPCECVFREALLPLREFAYYPHLCA